MTRQNILSAVWNSKILLLMESILVSGKAGLSFFCALLLLTGCDADNTSLALGTLERNRIAHTATISEVIVALPVEQGALVETGEVLVKLDDVKQKAQLAKAKAMVEQAVANYEKMLNGARVEEIAMAEAAVAGAKASVQEREASYKRQKDLFGKGLSSQASLDRALAFRDADVAALNSATEKLHELTAGAREEDLRIAKASLAAAQASFDIENRKLEELTIRATRDGVLDNLPWNLGERVTVGSPVAVVLAGKSPYARIYVPEPYRVKLKVGDQLVVRIDGLSKNITGRLRWIANDPAFSPYYALNQQERARLMYLAEVQLPDSASDLPNGVPAQVELP